MSGIILIPPRRTTSASADFTRLGAATPWQKHESTTDAHGLTRINSVRIRVHLCPSVIKIFGMSSYHLDHLQYLETEAIHIMREVAAEFERPVLLFSGGKDSICLLRLAEKAFRPSDIPMPFLNVETGHEFPELIEFRDRRANELGAKLIVRTVDEAIAKGLAHP